MCAGSREPLVLDHLKVSLSRAKSSGNGVNASVYFIASQESFIPFIQGRTGGKMGIIPPGQTLVLERSGELMGKLAKLDQAPEVYGLIHSDAHAGNYVNDGGILTFFDFDDCLYTWYGYDVATILLCVAIQPWVEDTQEAMASAVGEFLPVFMEGYCQASESGYLMWEHMHDFLKLRELSLYAVIHAHMDPEKPNGWLSRKFMRNRRARIERAMDYVDLDFSGY